MTQPAVPFIDRRVRHAGTSVLRELNIANLKKMTKAIVISYEGESLAVVLPFKAFLSLQEKSGERA